MKKMIFVVCCLLLLPNFVSAEPQHDTIVLKSKKVIEGNLIYADEEWVKIRQGANKILLISREDIFAIQRSTFSEGYIRYSKIRHGRSALEVASKTFANANKTKFVSLVGAVHIGDLEYYKQLQNILDAHDVVLFEGVGSISNEDLSQWTPPTSAEKEEELSGKKHFQQSYRRSDASTNMDFLTTLQTYMGQFLELSFQKDGLDYGRSWWKPADVSIEELQELMSKKGVNFLSLLSMASSKDLEQQANKIYASLLSNLSGILLGKSISVAMKETFAELLASQMMMMGSPSGKDSKDKANQLMEVLIVCRNDKAFRCTQDVMKVPGVKTIALFYGAGHNDDLEKRLVEEGFSLNKEEWLIAWDIKDESVSVSEESSEEEED